MKDDFKVSWTCIQGKSHKKTDPQVPCQDAFVFEKITNGGIKKFLTFSKPKSFSISIVFGIFGFIIMFYGTKLFT